MKREFLPLQREYFHRQRLEALLAKSLEKSLVTVVAGPGYGKTVAVAGFARNVGRRLIWMRMVNADFDPTYFWSDLIAATEREVPELAKKLENMSFPESLAQKDLFFKLVGKAAEDAPLLLIIDDYGSIVNPVVRRFFEEWISRDFFNFTAMIISNKRVPFGSIRPHGGHFRIATQDLEFTEEEIYGLFEDQGVDCKRVDIAKLWEDTGGWPLALHIICSKYAGNVDTAIRSMTHKQLAAELFENNYFTGYSEKMRKLLVQLAMLHRVPIELVHALQEEDIEKTIENLSLNMFIAYDYNTRSFAFQNMYRDFLLHKQGMVPPEDIRHAYSVAGEVYLKNNDVFEALACFWNILDYDRYIFGIMLLPKRRSSTDTTNGILQFLNKIPLSYTAEHPEVDFSRAFMYLNNMQINKAESIMQNFIARLDKREESGPEVRRFKGEAYIVLADICNLKSSLGAKEYMRQAAELLEGGSVVRAKDVLILSNNDAFFLPDNALGRFEYMIDYYFEMARYEFTVANGSGAGIEWLFSGEGYFLRGDMETAEEYCRQAIYIAQRHEQHDIVCNALWVLLRISIFRGEYERGLERREELFRYIDDRNLTDMIELRDCAKSWLYMTLEDWENVSPWIATYRPEAHMNLALDIGREKLLMIWYCLAQGNLQEAGILMLQMEEVLREKNFWQGRVRLQIMKAERYFQMKDPERAVEEFRVAYNMCYANDITCIFMEFGKTVIRIMSHLKQNDTPGFDMDWLDTLYQNTLFYAKRVTAMIKLHGAKKRGDSINALQLSKRETEVLHYLSQGLNREEIADLMIISINGVKKHISNIYTKLGAINRADAIYIATVEGLINAES